MPNDNTTPPIDPASIVTREEHIELRGTVHQLANTVHEQGIQITTGFDKVNATLGKLASRQTVSLTQILVGGVAVVGLVATLSTIFSLVVGGILYLSSNIADRSSAKMTNPIVQGLYEMRADQIKTDAATEINTEAIATLERRSADRYTGTEGHDLEEEVAGQAADIEHLTENDRRLEEQINYLLRTQREGE